jgi:hypothetical protein
MAIFHESGGNLRLDIKQAYGLAATGISPTLRDRASNRGLLTPVVVCSGYGLKFNGDDLAGSDETVGVDCINRAPGFKDIKVGEQVPLELRIA